MVFASPRWAAPGRQQQHFPLLDPLSAPPGAWSRRVIALLMSLVILVGPSLILRLSDGAMNSMAPAILRLGFPLAPAFPSVPEQPAAAGGLALAGDHLQGSPVQLAAAGVAESQQQQQQQQDEQPAADAERPAAGEGMPGDGQPAASSDAVTSEQEEREQAAAVQPKQQQQQQQKEQAAKDAAIATAAAEEDEEEDAAEEAAAAPVDLEDAVAIDEAEDEEEEAEIEAELALEAAAEQARTAAPKAGSSATAKFKWQDTSLSVAERVDALLLELTPKQKVAQLQSRPGNGIPELAVPAFNWQEECLHGVKAGGPGRVKDKASGTIYPISIAWAAAFDDGLAHTAASQIGDEMRAQYNRRADLGISLAYSNCFGPHVHVARDPRWGRLAETFGEDPLVNANMAVAHVTGLQGGAAADGESYLKTAATCKHFIGNDLEGWEGATRHNFDARIDDRDMRDTWLPPFEACSRDAAAASFMCSYNRVNGKPSCVNRGLLQGTLRGNLGFKGFVVTDCTALTRMVQPPPHGPFIAQGSTRRASALAIQAGTDMACHSFDALYPGDVTKVQLDTAVRRVLTARVRQGHLNVPSEMPWKELKGGTIGRPEHLRAAYDLAVKGTVLLKNDGVLPLKASALERLSLIGPFADQPLYQLGKYFGSTSAPVSTPKTALIKALPKAEVLFNAAHTKYHIQANVDKEVDACQSADVCVLVLGHRLSTKQSQFAKVQFAPNRYDRLIEGEGYDRTSLKLLDVQEDLWQQIAERTTMPLVIVLLHGGPIDLSDMLASPRVGAVLTAWYPGQAGGAALADILLGKVSPSGRLPVTWYRESYTKLPMTDMRLRAEGDYPGRTYRYWRGAKPLLPFGYGLSYVDWQYGAAKVAVRTEEAEDADSAPSPGGVSVATVSMAVRNAGDMPAETTVLAFLSYIGPKGASSSSSSYSIAGSGCTRAVTTTDLVQRLVGYHRTAELAPGAEQELSFQLRLGGGWKSSWAGFGDPQPPCGAYALRLGHDQPPAATFVLT